jgi:hypothetical protein
MYTGGQNKESVSGPGSSDGIKTVCERKGKVFSDNLNISPTKAAFLRQEESLLDSTPFLFDPASHLCTLKEEQRRYEHEVRRFTASYS